MVMGDGFRWALSCLVRSSLRWKLAPQRTRGQEWGAHPRERPGHGAADCFSGQTSSCRLHTNTSWRLPSAIRKASIRHAAHMVILTACTTASVVVFVCVYVKMCLFYHLGPPGTNNNLLGPSTDLANPADHQHPSTPVKAPHPDIPRHHHEPTKIVINKKCPRFPRIYGRFHMTEIFYFMCIHINKNMYAANFMHPKNK